jgi:NAD(P)-dependent dehydrogenase (short-subunit alcohol dehydrogenase family)
MEFGGKVAIITGASSGIGRAVALAFGCAGAEVVVAARREDRGEDTAAAIRESGGEATFVKCDVTSAGEVEDLVETAVSRYGRLDMCCNNAGFLNEDYVIDLEEADWNQVLDVNLKAVWMCMKHEISRMQTSGAIVNISSIAGVRGYTATAYVASKHGLIGLTKSAARQYGERGIRINAVCPGWVSTEMTADVIADQERRQRIVSKTPLGRIGTAEEMADAVLWLCSEQASFVTGHSLVVDGGYTIA